MLSTNCENTTTDQPFPQFGVTEDEVIDTLLQYHSKDKDYHDGKILNSICSNPLPIAVKAYVNSIHTNLGDNRLFPGATEIERVVTSMLGNLLGGDESVGNIVSGGTEANLLAMVAAKNYGNNASIASPEIIVPQSMHFSIDKIANILGVTLRKAKLNGRFEVDTDHVAALVNENTIGMIATLGTSELGAVDDVRGMATIAQKHNIYFHVDAATGGFIVPFSGSTDRHYPKFDFSLPGVCSITVDPHKYGLAVIPAGYILFKNKQLQELIQYESHYVGTHTHRTFLGTRSGASAASVYAVIKYLGKCGFEKLVRELFDKTDFLVSKLKENQWDILTHPSLSIVVIKCTDPEYVMDMLQQHKWIVSLSKRHNGIRIVVHHHHTREHISQFVNALNALAGDHRA